MSEIVFTDVAFRYQESGNFYVLQNLNVRFQSAHITVLTGASGCGKSTLLYLASGIYPDNAGVLSSGSVKIDGDDPSELPPHLRCRRVGMMFQNPALQFCMDTVRNELAFCLENVSTSREEMDSIIDEALRFCCIEHLKDRKLLTLSGGEKQKVMLACLAALSPAWILLDEPFANLDDHSAQDIAAKLGQLHRERGTGILAVDHRLDNWLGIADEVKGMDKIGNLIAEGLTLSAHDSGNSDGVGGNEGGCIGHSDALERCGIAVPGCAYPFYRHKKTPQEAQPEPLLRLRNITVNYSGMAVLRGLSADLSRGKSYALLGDSGSGKSTLFDVLRGLVPFDGALFYRGSAIRKKDLGRPGPMGFVTQNPQDQFVADTVYDEILTSLKSKGNRTSAPNAEEGNAESILRSIGLWGHRRVSPYMLSQGQQRRLGVAAILACGCEILICDEPTYAQDWNNTIAIMRALEKEMISQGTTLIFSTHDRKLAADFADKIFELKEGILLEYDQSDF